MKFAVSLVGVETTLCENIGKYLGFRGCGKLLVNSVEAFKIVTVILFKE